MDPLVKSVLGTNDAVVPKRAVLILSGGMDSVTMLHYLRAENYEVHTLSFDYGQRHSKELLLAGFWSQYLHCKNHKVIDLTALKQIATKSSLTSNTPVPEGHYENESQKATVVPNRNMVMLSLAVAYAENENIKEVYFAAHRGDHAIYPDCRPEFLCFMNSAAINGTYNHVQILDPFIRMTKRDIAGMGKDLKVDFSRTWSCYKGGERHCGKCGTCVERKEALDGFDTTMYETDYEDVVKHASQIPIEERKRLSQRLLRENMDKEA